MYYFAFGSNLNNEQMQQRSPGSVPMGPARLPGYALRFDGKSRNWSMGAVANIEPAADGVVWGGLYEMTERQLGLVDHFEHVPHSYQRQFVMVESEELGLCEAIAYLREPHPAGQPTREYLWVLIEGAIQNHLSVGYLADVVSKSGLLA